MTVHIYYVSEFGLGEYRDLDRYKAARKRAGKDRKAHFKKQQRVNARLERKFKGKPQIQYREDPEEARRCVFLSRKEGQAIAEHFHSGDTLAANNLADLVRNWQEFGKLWDWLERHNGALYIGRDFHGETATLTRCKGIRFLARGIKESMKEHGPIRPRPPTMEWDESAGTTFKRHNGVPAGYGETAPGVPDPAYTAIIDRMCALKREGLTLRAIQGRLRAEFQAVPVPSHVTIGKTIKRAEARKTAVESLREMERERVERKAMEALPPPQPPVPPTPEQLAELRTKRAAEKAEREEQSRKWGQRMLEAINRKRAERAAGHKSLSEDTLEPAKGIRGSPIIATFEQ